MSRGRRSALALVALAGAFAGGPASSAVAAGQPAAATGQMATIFFATSTFGGSSGKLWAVREGGARPRMLRRSVPVGPEGVTAALSADGRRIFCFCRRGEIDSIAANGSRLRQIGPQPARTGEDVVALSSGGRPFWVRGGARLMTEASSGRRRHAVFKLGSGAIEEPVAPSPDGRRLAFVAGECFGLGEGECSEEIETVGVDGGQPTEVFQDQPGRAIEDLRWSPDEASLAFSEGAEIYKGTEAQNQSDLFVVDSAGGSAPRQLTQTSPASEFYPTFSPDGTRLAYTRAVPNGFDQLLTLGLEGGPPALLRPTGCRPSSCELPPRVIGWASP